MQAPLLMQLDRRHALSNKLSMKDISLVPFALGDLLLNLDLMLFRLKIFAMGMPREIALLAGCDDVSCLVLSTVLARL